MKHGSSIEKAFGVSIRKTDGAWHIFGHCEQAQATTVLPSRDIANLGFAKCAAFRHHRQPLLFVAVDGM